jgi:hypothetical protein
MSVENNNDSNQQQQQQLTEKELQAVSTLKELIESSDARSKIHDRDYNDQYVIRWLKARKFDANKSFEMLQQHLKWREDTKVDNYSMMSAVSCLDTEACKIMGEDRWGRPTFIIRPGKHAPGSLPIDQVEALMVLTLEVAIRCLKGNNEHFILIFDYEGWGLRNVDKSVDNLIMGVGQSNYPERLAGALLVEPPWYFSTVWAIVKVFLGMYILMLKHNQY